MDTGTDRRALLAVPAAMGLLLWPALWNGYPIMFADTGTYLSQAIHRYAGWDRPVFYSLFIFPLHLTLTLWPVVLVQALLAAWLLWVTWRALGGRAAGFMAAMAVMAVGSWLPWIICEVMPDLFTPLLILALGLLAWLPDRVARWERWSLAGLATLCIATQQSSVPLSLGLAVFCLGATAWTAGRGGERARAGTAAWRDADRGILSRLAAAPCGMYRRTPERFGSFEYAEAAFGSVARAAPPRSRGNAPRLGMGRGGVRRAPLLLVPPALAVLALCGMNMAAHGRFAVSPFGNVFLLARVIGDGPGAAALRLGCPRAGWRLCAEVDRMPPTSDGFLWDADSPLYRVGGPKLVSGEADAIIAAALRLDPMGEARAEVRNAWTQLGAFASGDGLQAWPAQVSPWIARDFPAAEDAAYLRARQQRGALALPGWLAVAHAWVAVGGVAGCGLLLALGISSAQARLARGRLARARLARGRPRVGWRLPTGHAGLLLTVLLSLPLSAAITGALSAPHDRYQARIMWLPPFVAAACVAGRRQTMP